MAKPKTRLLPGIIERVVRERMMAWWTELIAGSMTPVALLAIKHFQKDTSHVLFMPEAPISKTELSWTLNEASHMLRGEIYKGVMLREEPASRP